MLEPAPAPWLEASFVALRRMNARLVERNLFLPSSSLCLSALSLSLSLSQWSPVAVGGSPHSLSLSLSLIRRSSGRMLLAMVLEPLPAIVEHDALTYYPRALTRHQILFGRFPPFRLRASGKLRELWLMMESDVAARVSISSFRPNFPSS